MKYRFLIPILAVGAALIFIVLTLTDEVPLIEVPSENLPVELLDGNSIDTDDFLCGPNFEPGLKNLKKPQPIVSSDLRKYDVIVIGAGVSGLEAAEELRQEGKDVLVLEGRDRIGGRTYTEIHDGMAFDIGGSWIHGLASNDGEHENPLYTITRKNGIKFVETFNGTIERAIGTNPPTYGLSGFERFSDSSGKKIDIKSQYWYYANSPDVFHPIWNTMLNETSEDDVITLENVLDEFESNQTAVLEEYELDPETKIDPTIYRHVKEWVFEQEAIGDIKELSVDHLTLDQYFYGNLTEGIFPDGYMQIADCLSSELNIKHANVTKVDYNDDPIIVLTDKNEKFEADYVVSTIPLGVLQDKVELFDPKLSDKDGKKKALENLGMGTMDKMYLIFDKAFWDSDMYEPGRYNAYIHRVSDSENDKTWKVYLNVHTYTGEPILLAFHTGSTAKTLENRTDDELEKDAQRVLQKMFPDSIVNEPKIIRTKWAEDPWSLGSYSFVKINGTPDDFDKLAEPVNGRIFFAGEATSRCGFGSVHGAYASGYRAAQEILSLDYNVDSDEEQLKHGLEKWEIVGKRDSTAIPGRCGGTAE